MAALISWYSNQYGTWNRTRRLAAPPFLARTDTTASRLARTQSRNNQNEGDVVINMNNGQQMQTATGNNAVSLPMSNNAAPIEQTPKNKDTLFGPSIGVVSSGPGWTGDVSGRIQSPARKKLQDSEKDDAEYGDKLTPEIVRGWIAKSREPSEPTTTLQALVNLKRPTIRLSPLAHDPSQTHSHSLTATEGQHDDPSASTDSRLHHAHMQQHGLEFEFDCDAPKCAIAVHVVGVPAAFGDENQLHHTVPALTPGASSSDDDNVLDPEKNRLLVFETTLDGGFGRKLDLDAGATLELARLEHAAFIAANAAAAEAVAKLEKSDSASGDLKAPANGDNVNTPASEQRHKKRLTFFKRKHNHLQGNSNNTPTRAPRPVTGPALAVVDAEAHASTVPHVAEQGKEKSADEDEGGVKVTIRLSALDAEGMPVLGARNEQRTYLHVVRVGAPPVRGDGDEGDDVDDTRPWVVKVVKREATIGPHTFHLHEIYGLSSHSTEPSHPLAPTAPTPAANSTNPDGSTHSYPPQPPVVTAPPLPHTDADFTSECLLCLSSPREVVLLPCRHLVACRECAVNMVEFGAGGTLVHSESDNAGNANAAGDGTGAEGESGATGTGDEAGAPSTGVALPAQPPAPTRRKRKAKGWFCPVCRQPYTSLLRITTSPPPPKEPIDAKRVSLASASGSDTEHDANQTLATHPNGIYAYPDTAAGTDANANPDQQQQRGGIIGGVANLMRPNFLRGLSSNRTAAGSGPGTGANTPAMTATELVDLERGRVAAAAT